MSVGELGVNAQTERMPWLMSVFEVLLSYLGSPRFGDVCSGYCSGKHGVAAAVAYVE